MTTWNAKRRKKGAKQRGLRAWTLALLALLFLALFVLLLWLVQDPAQEVPSPKETTLQEQSSFAPHTPATTAEPDILPEISTATETSSGRIEGVVLDTSGQAVSGARIWIKPLSPPGETMTTQSGPNGAFAVRDLGPGTYELSARRPFDARLSLEPLVLQLEAGEQRRGLRLILETREGHTVRAEVFGAGQIHIAGAEITALGTAAAQGRTDQEGGCILEGLPEGDYTFRASAEGYTEMQQQITVSPGQTNLSFHLERAGAVSGRVLSASDGQPIPEFEIGLLSPEIEEAPAQPDQPLQRFINEDGSFLLKPAPAGEHSIYARAPGFSPAIQAVTIQADETTANIEFHLSAGAQAEGQVTNWEGRPVAGAKLFCGISSLQVMKKSKPIVFSDPEGRFKLDSLKPGLNRISAFHPDYVPSYVDVELNPRKNNPINLVLEQGGVIEGRVTLDGRPVERAGIRVLPQIEVITTMDDLSETVTKTNPDGTFRLTDLIPGDVNVILMMPQIIEDGASISIREVTRQAVVSPGLVTEVFFDLQTHQGLITGATLHSQEHPFPVQIHVTIFNDAGEEETFTTNTNNGRYMIENLPTGTARVVATLFDPDSGQRSKVKETEVLPGRQTIVDFDFSSGTYLSGRVVGAMPQETVEVVLFRGAVTDLEYIFNVFFKPGSPLLTVVDVDLDGHFYVSNIEPGEVTVAAVSYLSEIASVAALDEIFNNIRSDLLVVQLEESGMSGLELHLR
jgi:large repetitive protein